MHSSNLCFNFLLKPTTLIRKDNDKLLCDDIKSSKISQDGSPFYRKKCFYGSLDTSSIKTNSIYSNSSFATLTPSEFDDTEVVAPDEGYVSQDAISISMNQSCLDISEISCKSPHAYQKKKIDKSNKKYFQTDRTYYNYNYDYLSEPVDLSASDESMFCHNYPKEREDEISELRKTFEKNELAMMKVHIEKEQNWQVEMHDLKKHFESLLKIHQTRAYENEEELLTQIDLIKHEKKDMQLHLQRLQDDKCRREDRYNNLKNENEALSTRLEEAQWDMCLKKNEVSLLKNQIKDTKNEVVSKNSLVISLKKEIKQLDLTIQNLNSKILNLQGRSDPIYHELNFERNSDLIHEDRLNKNESSVISPVSSSADNFDFENSSLSFESSSIGSSRLESKIYSDRLSSHSSNQFLGPSDVCASCVKESNMGSSLLKNCMNPRHLHVALYQMQSCVNQCLSKFEDDKCKWMDEKTKVVKYHKHLQQNYKKALEKIETLKDGMSRITSNTKNQNIVLTFNSECNFYPESNC